MAWNYGQRVQARGLPIFAVAPAWPDDPSLDLTSQELEAVTRLGYDGFRSWALRGWAAPLTKETM